MLLLFFGLFFCFCFKLKPKTYPSADAKHWKNLVWPNEQIQLIWFQVSLHKRIMQLIGQFFTCLTISEAFCNFNNYNVFNSFLLTKVWKSVNATFLIQFTKSMQFTSLWCHETGRVRIDDAGIT